MDKSNKNTAFVFIKPHANTEATKAMVTKLIGAKGLSILKSGTITAEEIDSKKLIDQHYYAIASKATILKPAQLNVPPEKFEGQFGVGWQAALDAGDVYNAMDACAELGLDADGLDAEWGKAKKAGKLIKFGGGFYCGLIEIAGKKPIYVFNGFFMTMRTEFTKPGLSISYFVVEWDAATMSWADFRGKMLGPTDPVEAPADSARGMILAKWKELGLTEEPNVGLNGVHASASPFEAMAEINNWLETPVPEIAFGAGLLAAGVPAATVEAWTVDPVVPLGGGAKGSLFDAVEDMDAGACTTKLLELMAAAPPKNTAFVFIKPHANTEATKAMVTELIGAKGLSILKSGTITAEEIDSKKLIDQHYYAIASKATILKPAQLNVPPEKFEGQFGVGWQAALDAGDVYNAMDACAELGLDADGLDAEWGKAKKAGKLIKFGGGFYCGLIEIEGKKPMYVFNGFFMTMRTEFTKPGLSISYFVVEWDAGTMSWADFRGKMLGPTDPADAPVDSARGMILAKWKEMGLTEEPNVGLNGVHASASPFEAMAEINNWLETPLESIGFGAGLLAAGVPEATVKDWTVDPVVPLGGGAKGSLFDALEDMDAADCTAKCVELVSA